MSSLPPSPDPARAAIASRIARFAQRWHAFEVHGDENIPRDGPALIVFYHGFIPLDAWYFGAWYYARTGRLVRALGDRFLFRTPGLATLVRLFEAVPGDRESAVRILREGHLVGVSPGGVREALSPREQHYQLQWGDRLGFARVAIEAQVPVIPAFCENIEEIYRAPGVRALNVHGLYKATGFPVTPVVGLGLLPLPVKLRSWVGAPVVPTSGESPEALRDRVRVALQALIDAHQHPGPRIPRALVQRLREPDATPI